MSTEFSRRRRSASRLIARWRRASSSVAVRENKLATESCSSRAVSLNRATSSASRRASASLPSPLRFIAQDLCFGEAEEGVLKIGEMACPRQSKFLVLTCHPSPRVYIRQSISATFISLGTSFCSRVYPRGKGKLTRGKEWRFDEKL